MLGCTQEEMGRTGGVQCAITIYTCLCLPFCVHTPCHCETTTILDVVCDGGYYEIFWYLACILCFVFGFFNVLNIHPTTVKICFSAGTHHVVSLGTC